MSFPWANEYSPSHPLMKWVDEKLPLPEKASIFPLPLMSKSALPPSPDLSIPGRYAPNCLSATFLPSTLSSAFHSLSFRYNLPLPTTAPPLSFALARGILTS